MEVTQTTEQNIERKLKAELNPSHLEIYNESANHRVPKGSETHFRVVAVSKAFVNLSRVQRHQKVYDVLHDELKTSVHALALELLTPDEWQARGEKALRSSPPCASRA